MRDVAGIVWLLVMQRLLQWVKDEADQVHALLTDVTCAVFQFVFASVDPLMTDVYSVVYLKIGRRSLISRRRIDGSLLRTTFS